MLPRLILSLLCAGIIAIDAQLASAQGYPNKPIRVIATEPGGGGDVASPLFSQGISGSLGKQLIIDNRGGSAVIAEGTVANAAPDGYTPLIFGSSTWLMPWS